MNTPIIQCFNCDKWCETVPMPVGFLINNICADKETTKLALSLLHGFMIALHCKDKGRIVYADFMAK
jgi:hypothetical protein